MSLVKNVRKNPILHIEKVQGCTTLEPYQKDIIQTLAEHERVAVRAAHDLGKTFIASKIVLWFGSTFPGAKIITTAPTYNQVKRLLWSEIRAGYTKSKYHLGGEMMLTEWKLAEDWFAIGFTSKAENAIGEGQGGASTFQGFHGKYMLVIFDEATGIAPSIWKQVEGLLTSGYVRFLSIGNPTTKSCEFYKCFSNPSYKKIKLSCFDSPNFTANGIHNADDLTAEYKRLKELSQEEQYEELQRYQMVNPYLITVKWVMQMVLKWGISHPLVVSKCFGEFPEEDEHTLIHLGFAQAAQYRKYKPSDTDRICFGVDVARFGSDSTVITEIHGKQQVRRKVMTKRDANEISGEIIRRIRELNKENFIHIVIDATGIGSGVIDILREKQSEKIIPPNAEIREVHFGASPGDRDSEKYVNLKAKIFCLLAEDLKTELCLLDEDVYLEQLPTIRYKFDSKGRWAIESKDDYKARTGYGSPDDSDSLALANYARYDAVGSGNFNQTFTQSKKSTIIGARGSRQW